MQHTDSIIDVPKGFFRLEDFGGFGKNFGPAYGKRDDDRLILGFRVQPHHLNHHDVCHGGAMATFADMQIMGVKDQMHNQEHSPTINLSIDYIKPVFLHDWVECAVILDKETSGMVFTRGTMFCDGQVVARSSAIYKLIRNYPR